MAALLLPVLENVRQVWIKAAILLERFSFGKGFGSQLDADCTVAKR